MCIEINMNERMNECLQLKGKVCILPDILCLGLELNYPTSGAKS